MYLRIVKPTYVFNPEHDLALANGDRHFIAPRNIREMARDLAPLMEVMKSHYEAYDLNTPLPWGWDSEVVERMRKMGISAALLPADNALVAFSGCSERMAAYKLLCKFRATHADDGYIGESCIVRSFEELVPYSRHYGHILLKAPLSSSGKGLRHVNLNGDENKGSLQEPSLALKKVESWANALMRKHGYLTAEPYYAKVQDFAMEFVADASGCHFIGYSLFVTDGHGRYIGSHLKSDALIEDCLAGYVPREMLHEVWRWTIVHYVDIIPEEWDVSRFPLYFGIDMMIVQDGSAYKLHPCVEINLRMNMGIIAHEVYRHRMVPGACGMFSIARFADNEALLRFHEEQMRHYPIVTCEGKLKVGYMPLVPIGRDTLHLAYVVCR